ncbi:MAG: hypothetical protein Q8N05_04820 [Bacteroidota bacterium]|nr:hypothetical protein [Bacteroidota bacterium]
MSTFRFKLHQLPDCNILCFRLSFIIFCIASFLFLSLNNASAQIDTTKNSATGIYLITTSEGNEFLGTISYQDEKEVVVETKTMGKVSIPKYQIREIKEVAGKQISSGGDYIPEQRFASRYFITTNGLPLEKGDNYILWNIYGPDIQFSVSDHFGIGIMTSWIGIPIIGTAKYSFNLGKNTNMALGALVGTGSWSNPDFALALPFAAFTLGDRRNNINFSGGYGAVWSNDGNEGRALFSIAGMATVSKKVNLVFDSFIVPGSGSDNNFALLIPGIRIQTSRGKFFQYGFAALLENGEFQSGMIPMIQWFQKF